MVYGPTKVFLEGVIQEEEMLGSVDLHVEICTELKKLYQVL